MSGRTVQIAEIGIDPEARLYVRPAMNDYEHVYRAAMELCWDRESGRLSHPESPRDLTSTQWFQQIIAAVADEYGDHLVIDTGTIWTSVSDQQRSEMERAASQS